MSQHFVVFLQDWIVKEVRTELDDLKQSAATGRYDPKQGAAKEPGDLQEGAAIKRDDLNEAAATETDDLKHGPAAGRNQDEEILHFYTSCLDWDVETGYRWDFFFIS